MENSGSETVVKLLLLGCGGVGRSLLHRIVATRNYHEAKGLHISVFGVCDSHTIVMPKSSQATELDDEDIGHLCLVKASGCPLESSVIDSLRIQAYSFGETGLETSFIEKCLGSFKGLVVADCTASVGISKFVADCLEKGSCVVLANKKPLTSTLALILARQLGWRLDLSDVQVESLYPNNMGPEFMSVGEFLEKGLASLNASMRKRVEMATSKGCVLRYVATIHDYRCTVGLMDISCGSPLGQLCGSDNLIEVYSTCYSSSPLVIRGAGAGNDTTAAGVLADIVDLQEFSA